MDKCEVDFSIISVITKHGAQSMTKEKQDVTVLLKCDIKASGNNAINKETGDWCIRKYKNTSLTHHN